MRKLSITFVLIMLSAMASAFELQSTSYDESHMKIVDSGFVEFKKQFSSSDDNEKESLLFCLERYVDPHYEAAIDYESELYDWLFQLLGSDESTAVKEHALDVLMWDPSREMHACEISSNGALVCSKEDDET